MSESFEYDVFLSYSTKDKDIVHALAKRLKGDGLRVWLDVWEINPRTRSPQEKIERGLEQSRTLALCMSPAYFDSEWAALEHHTLLFRDPTSAQRRFVPLLIEECTLPDVIAQFRHVEMEGENCMMGFQFVGLGRTREGQLALRTIVNKVSELLRPGRQSYTRRR